MEIKKVTTVVEVNGSSTTTTHFELTCDGGSLSLSLWDLEDLEIALRPFVSPVSQGKLPFDDSTPFPSEVVEHVMHGEKISAIKALYAKYDITLQEAKTAVEQFMKMKHLTSP